MLNFNLNDVKILLINLKELTIFGSKIFKVKLRLIVAVLIILFVEMFEHLTFKNYFKVILTLNLKDLSIRMRNFYQLFIDLFIVINI
jgi:hypothetical protein